MAKMPRLLREEPRLAGARAQLLPFFGVLEVLGIVLDCFGAFLILQMFYALKH